VGRPLESVDFDVVLLESVFAHLGLVFVGEEIHDFGAMVALKLDHLAHVGILDDGAIASCMTLESAGMSNQLREI
jgi:hypothetical protein